LGFQYLPLWTRDDSTSEQRISSAIRTLKTLTPGRYYFIDHPGNDTPEMQAIGHKGYENVADDREAVRRVFTSKEVKEEILKRNISLISYKEAAALSNSK
jgi:hypothetical protein